MTRTVRFLLLTLTVVLVLAGCQRVPEQAARPTPTTTTTVAVPVAGKCDPSLWKHVYHPTRLRVVRPCLVVTGKVAVVRHEADGDLHILLAPDAAFRWTLRQANVAQQHGDLVLEPVCVRPPTQVDAGPACAGYRSPVRVPAVGVRVRVVGSYVLDLQHGSWAEIHPVTSITIIRRH